MSARVVICKTLLFDQYRLKIKKAFDSAVKTYPPKAMYHNDTLNFHEIVSRCMCVSIETPFSPRGAYIVDLDDDFEIVEEFSNSIHASFPEAEEYEQEKGNIFLIAAFNTRVSLIGLCEQGILEEYTLD